jgi:dTDP-4-amino-4,6-dideoxygalactose transaminase
VPAIGCPSILATVLLSGLEPVIVDVDRNLNIDPTRVQDIIKPGDIVLGVHIFGIPCEIELLEKICRENDAVLIEDAAQAIGGKINGRTVGTFGRASVLSFAEGKILPTIGGGAILTDDVDLIGRLRESIQKLPERPDDLEIKAKEIRDTLTDAFNEARRDDPSIAKVWQSVYSKYPDIYSYTVEPDETEPIIKAIREMGSIAVSRRMGVGTYMKYFDGLNVEHLNYTEECSPFRFSFILKELSGTEVQECTEAIRSGGMHASNLYLPLHWLAPHHVENTGCPRAEFAGARVINLWLDNGILERDASKVAEIVRKWTG